jgi:two-component system cell cycle response regulator
MSDEWQEEDTSTTDIEEVRSRLEGVPRRATLTVLTGTSTGQMYKVPKSVRIGRSPTCEIRIDDDGLSRKHAHVRLEGEQAFVEDMASRNGTFVNGTRIDKPTALNDGDKLQIGRATVLRFAYQDALDDSFHENLLSSALRDGLTKLFNKRYLLDRLDSELKFAHRHETALSLLMLDLDHFKETNDTHGHLAGDALLTHLATTLTKAVRNEDVIARFGGEEFAIVLRAIGIEPATQTAERLRRHIEQTVVPFQNHELRATVSIGVAGVPSTRAKTVEELVEAADLALYRAKHAGRNKVSR